MSRSSRLSHADTLKLMRHLADVVALKRSPVEQRQLLIDGLNRLAGTNQAFLYAVEDWRTGRVPVFTHRTLTTDQAFLYAVEHWRTGRVPVFTHRTLTTDQDPVFLEYMRQFGERYPLTADPFCDRTVGDRSPLQLWTFADVLPDRAAERRYGAFLDIKRAGRISDGVVSFFRDGPTEDRVVGVGMHVFGAAPRLRPRQRALVRLAVAEIRGLVNRGHLQLATPPAPPELPPRLRQIFDRLLLGQTPKRIAREMGLSIWTVRQHIQRLYRRFDVSGREELMARFVGLAPAPPAAN